MICSAKSILDMELETTQNHEIVFKPITHIPCKRKNKIQESIISPKAAKLLSECVEAK